MTVRKPSNRPAASLSTRLILGAVVWLILILILGGGLLAWAFRDTVENEFSRRLDAVLNGMIASMATTPDGGVALTHPLGDPRFEQVYSGWYWQIMEPSGALLRSRSLWDSALQPTGNDTKLHLSRAQGPKGEPLLVAERDIEFPDVDGLVHVMVAADLREVSDGVRRFNLLLVTALGSLGFGLAVAILIQVRFGLRPLRDLAADLDAVRRGVHPRLADRYPKEVAPLAKAMNGVLDKDAELIERARRHVGNLAHGLKTPLSVISAEMEGKPGRRVLREQVQVMQRLIEHHLGRAAAVAGAGGRIGVATPIAATARNIAGILNKVFADKNLKIDIVIDDTIIFPGHREDLEEILGNLMENACKWATLQIRVSAEQTAEGVMLLVEDDGPGMSVKQAAEASRRGKRFDEIAPGWGLGLSIVSDLVEVTGGTLELTASPLGGLMARVKYPLN
ncbi:MAG: sensor histidine kinase [Alphaproteobacteria bacterium]